MSAPLEPDATPIGRVLEGLRGAGDAASRVAERYIPDAWVVCMVLTVAALALAVGGAGVRPDVAVRAWADGLWGLLQLTMQFTITVLAAYACVMSRPGFRAFDALARLPNPDRPVQAVLLTGAFSLVTGYLNWAFCFIGTALLIPFVVRHNPKADVRVIAAAAFIGVGTVTNGGLSGSAALIMATPDNPLVAPARGEPVVERLYPITETIFSSFNLTIMALIAVVSLVVLALLHPRRAVVTWSAERVESTIPKPPELPADESSPAGRLNRMRLWTYLAGGGILYTLGHSLVTQGFASSWNINAYNAVFLGLALILHGHPLSFVQAARRGLDSSWGIVLQFPFYGGIFGLMTGTALGVWMAEFFVGLASAEFFPLVVYLYSALLNFFVPSAGSKWLIEAPYLLDAAATLGVSNTTVLLAYIYGDSLTNLIHPYMAIAILSITGLKFGEFAGYAFFVGVALLIVMSVAMLFMPLTL